jgi:hypothetical protein
MSDEDINAALDRLGLGDDPIEPGPGPVVEPEEDQEPDAVMKKTHEQDSPEVESDPQDDKPPGFIDNLEDWVAAGKDPDKFKGKQAYIDEHDRIVKAREAEADLKRQQAELKEQMNQVVEFGKQWREDLEARHQKELDEAKRAAQSRLDDAREYADIDKALEAQRELSELDAKSTPAETKPAQQEQQSHPVLADYYAKNPIADIKSSQFDQDYFDDLSAIFNANVSRVEARKGAAASDDEIRDLLTVATGKAKKMHSEKFVNPRNERARAPSSKRPGAAANVDYGARVKAVKVDTLNEAETNASSDVYNMIRESYGEEAAASFAKKLTEG